MAKDQVFALIDLSKDRGDDVFKRWTTKCLQQVTIRIVERHQDLDFILMCRRPGSDIGLQSWVPEFRLGPKDSSEEILTDVFGPGGGFTAYGDRSMAEPAMKRNMRFLEDVADRHDAIHDTFQQTLVVPGLQFDTITALGDVCSLDSLRNTPGFVTLVPASVQTHHQTILAQSSRMVDKLGGERHQKRYSGPFVEPYSSAPSHTLVGDRVNGKLCLEVKRGFFNYDAPHLGTLPNEIQLEGVLGPEVLKLHMPRNQRRFMTLRKGYIGLAPPEPQIGDWVCIFQLSCPCGSAANA